LLISNSPIWVPAMKRILTWFAAAIATTVTVGSMAMLPVQAVKLSDGKVYFTQPPRLLGATTTQKATYVWGATYYFTLEIAENAGEPLQQVTIVQRPSPDYVRFDVEDTRAFEGTSRRKGQELKLAAVTQERETRAVTIRFDPPVEPGRTVTIALRPYQNPDVGGTYLFGVTAFPAGEQPYGQFLGFGRLQFYDPGRDGSFLLHRGPFIRR
jgi:hypothetical protein